jgi:hypothetical protein
MFQSNIPQIFNTPIVSSSVKLFVFTPRIHGTVCIRPAVYNFNAGTVEELFRGPTCKHSCAKYDGDTPNLIKAIVPDSQGVIMNTSHLDSMWSFILVFENGKSPTQYRTFGSPIRRTVITGYFIDEPIAPTTLYTSTPIMNERAMMLFTHRSMAIITANISMTSKPSMSIAANNDYVPQAFAMHAQVDNLSLVDAASIARSQAVMDDGSTMVTDHNGTLLKNCHNASPILTPSVKTPRQQMMAIASAIDSASEQTQSTPIYSSLRGDDEVEKYHENDPFNQFKQMFINSMSAPSTDIQTNDVDASRVLPLASLMFKFQNLEVYPIKIPTTPQFEVGNQSDINVHNSMSSMVQSTVSAYAQDLGLSSIAFRYESYIRNEMASSPGVWQLFRVTPFMAGPEITEQMVSDILYRFRTRVENDLFPVLRAFSGEFSLFVDFDMIASTVIDLQYMDCPTNHGLYEAHNRLGGVISPAIGSGTHLVHNRASLDTLSVQMASNIVGRMPLRTAELYPNQPNF